MLRLRYERAHYAVSGAHRNRRTDLSIEGDCRLQLDYGVLGTFTVLWLAIVPTPGPNSLLIIHLALTGRWRDVAVALLGNLLAIAGYALATLLGLALILTALPSVRLGLYLAGGGYLLWVGWRLMRGGLERWRMREGGKELAPALSSTAGPFVQGVTTALANVQALFFLASIFASVGILAANLQTGLAAVAIIIACNGAYLALLAWLMQRAGPRAFYARHRGLMEIGFGALFLAFGARLIWRELAGWV